MNILDIDILQVIISIIGSVYYAVYSVVYGLYESMLNVFNPAHIFLGVIALCVK